MTASYKRNLSIDLLRIIAASMVLAVHVGQLTGVNNYTEIGAKGVLLFFIISGYLAMSTCQRLFENEGGRVIDYYIDRVKKIIPLYYWVLFLEYIYSIYMYYSQGMEITDIFELFHGPCGLNYFRYVFFLQYILPSENFNFWNNRFALWTMSSFAFFYVLAPWIYKILNNWKKVFAVTAILMFFRTQMIQIVYYIFDKCGEFDHLDLVAEGMPINQLRVFLLGVLVWQLKDQVSKFGLAFFLSIVVVLSSTKFYCYEFLFVIILIMALEFPLEDYVCEKIERAILSISRITFCVYLTHPIFIEKTYNIIVDYLKLTRWNAFISIFLILFTLGGVNYWFFQKVYNATVQMRCYLIGKFSNMNTR